jgi:NAD(P)-dependent dehydrogenase (short-subunit alcohol dehydrogenase family)
MATDIVVVTGAAGVLGKAIADLFLKQGANVIAVDRDERTLRDAFGEAAHTLCVAVDLTDAQATGDALSAAIEQAGTPTVLCNIAGGFAMGWPVHDTPDAAWRKLFDLNVSTLFNASRVVVPHMVAAGAGKVINVSAGSADSGKASMGAYCASKDVVARLTESMALELREAGINVNAVAPSIIDTPANRAAMPDADTGKWVSVGDLAAVIAFLASAQANAVHGAVLPVSGLS